MIDRSYIEELIARNDIVEIVGTYVSLKRSGRGHVGLCPFHNERTPSFSVNGEHQYYHCFGCGAGGGVINFVMMHNNLGYIEAVKFLAQRVGMKMPDEDDEYARRRSRLFKVNKLAARYFHENLLGENGARARDYLHTRGLSSAMVTRFGIGYASEGFNNLTRFMRAENIGEEELVTVGLIRKGNRGHYDFFRDRIMFPIIDLQNNVIAFGGRLIEGEGPKYLNTSDTPIFNKGNNLFALNLSKKERERRYLLCEGYMDVVALHGAGFKTAVATLGTALTAEQAKLLSNYADRVVLCYDSDDAGQRATAKATGIFAKLPTEISVLEMEGAKDPDEYIKRFGKEYFSALIDKSNNTVEYALRRAKQGIPIETDEGRVRYIRQAVDILADMTVTATEREVYAGRIEGESGVSKTSILAQLESVLASRRRRQKKQSYADTHSPYAGGDRRAVPTLTLQLVTREQQLVAALLIKPELIGAVGNSLDRYTFCEPALGEAFAVAKRYYEAGEPAEYAIISGELGGDSARALTATMAKFGEVIPTERDIELYINSVMELSGSQSMKGDIKMDELGAYLERLKEKKK